MFTQDKFTVSLPGEVPEKLCAKKLIVVSNKALGERNENNEKAKISCLTKYCWIKPLNILCNFVGLFYH